MDLPNTLRGTVIFTVTGFEVTFINIAIIDDKRQDRSRLLTHMERFMESSFSKLQISQYVNGESFVEKAVPETLDAAFIDIIMGGLSGIDVARHIRERNEKCVIVFISSSNHFAAESYQVNALEYLSKPYLYDDIERVMKKILKIRDMSAVYIEVTENRKRVQIKASDILYVDYYRHSVLFNTERQTIKTYAVRFSEVEEKLLMHPNFIVIRKNLIVNMDKALQISDKQFLMCNDVTLPISREVYSKVKNEYTDYLFKKLREEMG